MTMPAVEGRGAYHLGNADADIIFKSPEHFDDHIKGREISYIYYNGMPPPKTIDHSVFTSAPSPHKNCYQKSGSKGNAAGVANRENKIK